MDITTLLAQFMALAGVGAFFAFVVNALKQFGVVKDGDAPTWSTALNLAGMVALLAVKVFVPNVDIDKLDGIAASLAQLGVLILGLITQLGFAKLTHFIVKGVPVIGKSYSQS